MKELERGHWVGGGPFVLAMQHIMYSFWIIRMLKKNSDSNFSIFR